MRPTNFARLLTKFLSEYLPGLRNVSTNTIQSYRDAFRLMLIFCDQVKGLKPEDITLEKIDADLIGTFLEWLEDYRRCNISSRNQRLAAIHSFYRYVQMEMPELLLICQKILNIPFKKKGKKPIDYFSIDALKLLFEQPDTTTVKGRRDLVMMVLLYDTGARVQELIDLTVRDIRLDPPAVVTLTGKGNKKRCVPIMSKTTLMLKNYLAEKHLNMNSRLDFPVFFNSQGHKYTRPGISYILNKYFKNAKAANETVIFPQKISPHMFRHTKAMHLIEANVNLIYIRDLLGHVNVTTTECYAKANTEIKRKALESAYLEVVNEDIPSWKEDTDLLNWLHNLCK